MKIIIKIIFFMIISIYPVNAITYQAIYTNYEGNIIPLKDENIVGNERYKIIEYDNNYTILRMDDKLILPKFNFANYTFHKNRISWNFSTSPTQLNSRSIQYNATLWYIEIPKSLYEKYLIFDNDVIITNDINKKICNNNYTFTRNNDKIRLWYNLPCRLEASNSTIINFISNSYIIYDNVTSWNGISHDSNITIHRENGTLELNDAVPDFFNKWRFDNNSGTIIIDENNTQSKDNIFYGGSVILDGGRYLNSIKYDGINDYSKANHNLYSNNQKTICTWINHTTTASQAISSYNAYSSFMVLNTNKIRLELLSAMGNSGRIDTSDSITLNNFTQLCYVQNELSAGTGRTVDDADIYINGKNQVKTFTSTGVAAGNSNIFYISSYDSASLFFTGYQDDIRIYGRKLSNDEINLTYQNAHKTNGSITTNITNANIGYVNKYFTFSGKDRGNNISYRLEINGSDDNITFSGWLLVNNSLNINDNTTIPDGLSYRYSQFRLYENTSYLSESDEIYNINIEKELSNVTSPPIVNNICLSTTLSDSYIIKNNILKGYYEGNIVFKTIFLSNVNNYTLDNSLYVLNPDTIYNLDKNCGSILYKTKINNINKISNITNNYVILDTQKYLYYLNKTNLSIIYKVNKV